MLTVFAGDQRAAREAAVRRFVETAGPKRPALHEDWSAADWPFQRDVIPRPAVADRPAIVWIRDLHEAFPAYQTAGTRLVLTQSTYQLQRWLDWLDAHPQCLAVADADRQVLARSAPEAAARRGPWARIHIIEADADTEEPASSRRSNPLQAAFFSNLGAALGELDRGDDALAALQQALPHDPYGHPVINNLGAVYRELGRLDDAERAFRQVVGHTLFLAGRFAEARDVYQQGMLRDPQRNPRQACRLAVARAAAGDARGAITDLGMLAERVPADVMRDVLAEAESTLLALSAVPGVDAAGVARVLERVKSYSS